LLDESATWNLGSLRVPYVTTKRKAEEMALAAANRNLEVVVVNPAAVVGPDDFSSSEFGTLCRRFWRRRIVLHFGGGNNFVDVRDVAHGMLLAGMSGRTGQRYILGGTNRSMTAFFAELARAEPKPIFRLRLPNALAALVAHGVQQWQGQRARRSYLTPAQAKLTELFFYFTSEKARREFGYQPRPLWESIRDTHAFWMGARQCA
jgi:dihydroflavonol-4-reductase